MRDSHEEINHDHYRTPRSLYEVNGYHTGGQLVESEEGFPLIAIILVAALLVILGVVAALI